jgi:hypothetical protein
MWPSISELAELSVPVRTDGQETFAPRDPVFPDERGEHTRPRSARIIREDLRKAGCSEKYEGHAID